MQDTTIFLNKLPAGEVYTIWSNLGIAILIGLLIGLEREYSKSAKIKFFAGVRTYPLISIFGFLSAMIASLTEMYLYGVFFLGFVLVLGIAFYFASMKGDIGATSEVASVLTFMIGSLVFWDFLQISAALAVIIVIFLSLKEKLHSFVGKIEEEDIAAALKFAVITVIILPLLPDRTYDPLDVLNPRKIWYMVVLIAGISFLGYILFKVVGTGKGIRLLAILGGIVSSTAATLSFTQKSKEAPELSQSFAAAIILASSVMIPRIFIIVFILDRPLALFIMLPLSILFLVNIGISIILWRTSSKSDDGQIKITNPFKLSLAIKFGLIFAAILFISKAAQVYLGSSGIYLTSLLGGLADVDAIALSITNLSGSGLSMNMAASAILIAFFANSFVKASISISMGSRELRKSILPGAAVSLSAFLALALYSIMIGF
ncbi:MAG TPA: MgtC/SapB family protein [Ignavibacteriales bacterium]|nr:MgtC/SapB family protein [Ignavibacteriales bacterium]